jgi:hypothetical protein
MLIVLAMLVRLTLWKKRKIKYFLSYFRGSTHCNTAEPMRWKESLRLSVCRFYLRWQAWLWIASRDSIYETEVRQSMALSAQNFLYIELSSGLLPWSILSCSPHGCFVYHVAMLSLNLNGILDLTFLRKGRKRKKTDLSENLFCFIWITSQWFYKIIKITRLYFDVF